MQENGHFLKLQSLSYGRVIINQWSPEIYRGSLCTGIMLDNGIFMLTSFTHLQLQPQK